MSSGDFTSLRGIYPGILSITRADVTRLCSETHDPAMRLWLESTYKDVQRAKKHTQLQGWNRGCNPLARNPFMAMDLANWGPDIPDDVLDATHGAIVRANSWLGVGVWTLAEEYFQKALSLAFKSNNVFAALQLGTNLGLCYVAAGDQDNALRVVNQALPVAIQIQNWNTVHRMGTIKRICLARAGRWDLVTVETQKLRGITRETDLASLDESAFEIIADIYQFTGDRHRLQAWKDEWSRLSENIQALVTGTSPKGKLVKVIRSREAMRVDRGVLYPGIADVMLAEEHFNRGLTYGQQGHWEDAIREYQAALRIDPNYAEAHYNLGVAYYQQGCWEDAIREYQAALRINPDYAEAHYNLGMAYGQQGRLDDEIRELQATLRINPHYADAHNNLGLAYYQRGRLDEAICEFQAALRINPNLAEAHGNLGLAYKQQGRLDEAICELQIAVQLGFKPAYALLAELLAR